MENVLFISLNLFDGKYTKHTQCRSDILINPTYKDVEIIANDRVECEKRWIIIDLGRRNERVNS
jgi:hypothetical protein